MGRLDIMEVNAMALSNTLFTVTKVTLVVDTVALTVSQGDKFAKQIDLLAADCFWTDLVGFTGPNVKAGKCTATKEGNEQVKEAISKMLKRRGKIHTSQEAQSRMSKLARDVWAEQDGAGFEACGGKLQNIGNVAKDANGVMRATRKEDTLSSIEEKRQKQFKGLHSWITNHEDDLGDLYKPTLATVNAAMTELKLVIPVKV